MRVFVYFNLHKTEWSVKALDGKDKGRVILHTDRLYLADCTFKVSEAGRQRVLKERRKNVHAGVVGRLLKSPPPDVECTRRVTYDPYKYDSFVDAQTLQPERTALYAAFRDKKVFVPANG